MDTGDDRQRLVEQQRHAVAALRKKFRALPRMTMRRVQASFPPDAPARGPIWIARTRFQPPRELHVRDLLFSAIEALAQPHHTFPPAECIPVTAVALEWLAHRPGADARAPEPAMSESEKQLALQRDAQRPSVVLYTHGGAFHAGNPASVRLATVRLATLTGGRVASVAYRLSPQHQFPAALLDAFVAYLTLLCPGPEDLHEPIAAQSIVLAGESAGANLSLALTQLLLELRRQGADSVRFHGRSVPLDLPGGIATLSAYSEYSMAVPSWTRNDPIDILANIQPCHARDGFDVDDVWPTQPPRGDVYCDTSMFSHPLVNPNLAPSWQGCPPMWFAAGEERLVDGIRMLAQRVASSGTPVAYTEYEGMPHNFAIMLSKMPQSVLCFKDWAAACARFAEGTGATEAQAKVVHMPGDRRTVLDVKALSTLSLDQLASIVHRAAEERDTWRGPGTVRASL